jgi:hypothetical protein
MIDVFTELLLDLHQACKLPPFLDPRTQRPMHISGMYRQINRGARAADGQRIRLEVIRTPRGMRTSREAVGRFIEALSNPKNSAQTLPQATRRKQITQANAELSAAGFELAPMKLNLPAAKSKLDASRQTSIQKGLRDDREVAH